ncbi:unnamed protein product [Parnassius apollo]|uniref:(apollo) hypothetical protein n=1 Tax=Parnassius apollo TaxID=110799 RepID=A0A8S3WBP0_PARAO|nr:unnamed protein product [Parnassius apollo]
MPCGFSKKSVKLELLLAELDDEAIGNLLEDSDIGDFIPSDDDFHDPEFIRPESSMSSTEEKSDGPDVSTSFIQARGRT